MAWNISSIALRCALMAAFWAYTHESATGKRFESNGCISNFILACFATRDVNPR